jgi:hypothetical protein
LRENVRIARTFRDAVHLFKASSSGSSSNMHCSDADWYWYSFPEEIAAYAEGNIPITPCPFGSYRDVKLGLRQDGCVFCPPGYYASTRSRSNNVAISSTSSLCIPCPRGTYLDVGGGLNIDNCIPCPKGSYGDAVGLTSRDCSGKCSDLNNAKTRYYGMSIGLTSKSDCSVCPDGYLDVQAQCENMEQFLDMYARTTKMELL